MVSDHARHTDPREPSEPPATLSFEDLGLQPPELEARPFPGDREEVRPEDRAHFATKDVVKLGIRVAGGREHSGDASMILGFELGVEVQLIEDRPDGSTSLGING